MLLPRPQEMCLLAYFTPFWPRIDDALVPNYENGIFDWKAYLHKENAPDLRAVSTV